MGGENSPSKLFKVFHIILNKNKNQNDFIINLFGDEKKT